MGGITTLFFDIGGVCLSNGWDHDQRQTIAREFSFDYAAFESRHRQVVDALERGRTTLNDYFRRTLFYEPRPFGPSDIIHAVQRLSTPFEATLELARAVRRGGTCTMMTINNESRELNEYRIARFGLREIFSAFFSSCYLGLLKPQPEHFRRALDITQRAADECLYVDDRPGNVEVARILGMHAFLFTDAARLEADLRGAGLDF